MKARRQAATIARVPVWGPEPIGASTIDSLDVAAGLQLSGANVLPGWGLDGSIERTDNHYFVNPQLYAGLGGAVVPSPPDLTALPSSNAPTGFYGL